MSKNRNNFAAARSVKSVERRGVVVALPGRANISAQNDGRVRAPSYLTKDQSDIWAQIVASKPADWFGVADAGILAMYCRAQASANHLAKTIDKFERRKKLDSDEMRVYQVALRASECQSKLVLSLATKMRLTQQARYTPQAAGTAAKRGGVAKKPWDE